jgi:hypothetical protein
MIAHLGLGVIVHAKLERTAVILKLRGRSTKQITRILKKKQKGGKPDWLS